MNRLLIAALVLPLLSGCSLLRELLNTSASSFGPPTASATGASVTEATLDGAQVEVRFSLQNPNAMAMEVSDIRHAVEVDGVSVPSRGAPAQLTLQPGAQTQLAIPVQLTFTPAEGKQSVRVQVYGQATAQTATGPVKLPLNYEGEVAVAQAPEVAWGLPRLTGLGFTSAGLEVPITLKNPNAYPLGLGSLDGAVKLGGTRLGQVASGQLGRLQPGESRELPVPLVLEFAKLGSTLLSAVTSPLELDTQLGSGAALVPVKLTQALALPKAPALSFGGIGFSELGLDGVTLELKYAVDNPNPLPIKLEGVKYALQVEGKSVVAGGPKDGTEIAAGGRTDLVFPARVKFMDLASSLPALLSKDRAKLGFTGSLGSKGPAGVDALSLSHQDTFQLPKLPQFSIGAPKIAGMDFTSARIELPVILKNLNSFALPIGNVAGAVSLSGSKIGNVATGELGMLEAGQQRTVNLPLTLKLAEVASAALALGGSSVPLAFNGEVVSGAVRAPIQWSQSVRFTK